MSEAWILMKCGCRIDCNVKPKHPRELRKIHMMAPVAFQKEKIASLRIEMPTVLIEAYEENWIEIRADHIDREKTRAAHEFIRHPGSTMKQRRDAVLRFGVRGGQVPRCWVES